MIKDCLHIFGQHIDGVLICDIKDVDEAAQTLKVLIAFVRQDRGNDRTTYTASA
jgi:hypothetical protein